MIPLVAAALLAQIPLEVRVTSELVTNDSGREILSPALPRNGWSTFNLRVDAPAMTQFKLWVGLNPENALRVEVFRDGRRCDLPYASVVPPGAKSVQFRMRLWADRTLPPQRMKVEPEVWVDNRWIVYPMEVRVVQATIPDGAAASASWQQYFCGKGNALPFQQDILLSQQKPRAEVQAQFQTAAGMPVERWCKNSSPEIGDWYLNFRDWLLK